MNFAPNCEMRIFTSQENCRRIQLLVRLVEAN